MYLTPHEALAVLRQMSAWSDAARAEWDRRRDQRDQLLQALDGQQGMGRTAMAEACGIDRTVLWRILDRRHEALTDDVLLTDELHAALVEALEGVSIDESERIRFDVHA